jgi:hypothetical protein
MANNQIEYPISGAYDGNIITTPAFIPEPPPPIDTTPTIVKPLGVGSESETNIIPKNINSMRNPTGFGIVSVTGQDSLIANSYMDQLNIVSGNNINITTDAATTSVTISAETLNAITDVLPGTGIGVTGNSTSVIVTNTFTEIVYSGGNAIGTLTPNRNNGTVQKFTLTGNIVLAPPTNMLAGQSLTLILTQDSVGNRILDANTAYLFASGFQTLSTASGAIDMINIFTDGTTYYGTLTVGYS